MSEEQDFYNLYRHGWLAIGLLLHPSCKKSAQNARRGIVMSVGIVLKNLLGLVLILVGVILSVPGLPGRGTLTLLAKVLLPVDGSATATRATQKLIETLGWYREQPKSICWPCTCRYRRSRT